MKPSRFALALGLVTFLTAFNARPAWAEPKPIYALALTSREATNYPLDPKMAEYFAAENIHIVSRPLSQPLSQDILRQFHLVILTTFSGLRAPWFALGDSLADYYTLRQSVNELRTYVESGGGLFFIPEFGWAGTEAAETMGELLDPWGIGVVAASPYDPAHAWQTYGWTENISRSPVTRGMSRLYYPMIIGRWDDLYPTATLTIRDAKRWTPVVRGMKGSITAKNIQSGENAGWYPVPGSQDPPVLAAAAELGAGRAAILTISPLYLLATPYLAPDKTWYGEFTTGPIDGVVVEKGDGQTPSQGRELVRNALTWLAGPAAAKGFGSYTPDAYAKLPLPPKSLVPGWLYGWNTPNNGPFHKVLIGARSAYSDGKGAIADYADAARTNGYAILVMTETFEKFAPDKWDAFYRDCTAASSPDFVVVPGIDIPDSYGNRYLLFGQSVFPQPFMLTEDRRAIKQVQFLMLGLRPSMSAIARPSSTPGDHHLHKFYSGYAVYTYRNGQLVDDGFLGYQWAVHGWSDPLPLAVHETYAPDQIAREAQTGHQLYVPADTVENAAWYLRQGEAHYWENPPRFLVTAGPMIRTLTCQNFRFTNHVPGVNIRTQSFAADDDVPITDARLISNHNLLRRWKPNATNFAGDVAYPPGNLFVGVLVIADQKGRTAITPTLAGGTGYGYNKRCSDRQNFFSTPIHYPGTRIFGGYDIWLPSYGTDEGKGLWPHGGGPRRGENLSPALEFAYVSPAVSVTDAYIDQRYWKALWEDAAFDARSPQGTTRSRVYEGRFRYWDFHCRTDMEIRADQDRRMMVAEINLRLRIPVIPTGDVFPAFYNTGPQPVVQTLGADGKLVTNKVVSGFMDLPVGACAGALMALTPGLRVNAAGLVGFAPPAWDNGALPALTEWTGRVVQVDTNKLDLARMQTLMLGATAPYALALTRGKLLDLTYVANLQADRFGVAGTVTPHADMPYAVPLSIDGLNWNWPAAIWRPGTNLVHFGVFEGRGRARLDVTRGGAFFTGSVVTASDPRLRITLLDWTPGGIQLEVNNTTDAAVTNLLETAAEITDLFRLKKEVVIASGACVRLTVGQ